MALCANQIKALSLSANQKTSWKYDFEYSPHFVDIFSMHGSFFQSFFGSFFRFQFFHLFRFFFIYLDFCLPWVTVSGFQRSFWDSWRLLWGHIEVIWGHLTMKTNQSGNFNSYFSAASNKNFVVAWSFSNQTYKRWN